MREYKILFTGTMGAGKTTAIAAISETPPVTTDVVNTDETLAKKETTVGLDYGLLTLESGDRIRLFGTPGQARFDFLWPILAHNALGIVILVDNSRPDPLADFEVYLDGFRDELTRTACTVGVGRTQTHPEPDLDRYAEALARRGLVLPVIPVDVREREDVVLLVDTLLSQLQTEALWSET
ncbi:MAG: GTP-binding protein [Burkholderiaceae bacterium]